MHTGQPDPQSMINENISGEIVLDNSNNKFILLAINVSNNFATIEIVLYNYMMSVRVAWMKRNVEKNIPH